MVNGSRQRFDRATGKLSVLTFDRYTLDLNMLRDEPVVRWRDAQERFLGRPVLAAAGSRPVDATAAFWSRAISGSSIPLSVFSFVAIPLACLLPGEFNRRGQLRRVLLAVGLAFAVQALELGVRNLAGRNAGMIPLMYLVDLLPLALGFGILPLGAVRLDFWRLAPALR